MADAAAEVKEIQKASAEGRKQWSLWCETHGHSVRDPTKHSPEFLREFLEYWKDGGRLEASMPAKVEVLAELVKNGQRNSHHWQQAWRLYCERWGGGVLGFLDLLATRACMELYSSPVMDPSYQGTDPSYHWNWNESDPVKEACVQKIKTLQRSSEDAKRLWWEFCDLQQGGVRDPTRHDVRVLQEFLSSHNIS
ncbi:unnamed protein product [Effrenium voratum]|uniref:Uncharacterized protein n=1 Tax=Effrenium voratum TaxID=2562239 RepID=A0AA36N6K4_9DINO|nr:unnamed protein product [Effrenium voratum]CAJ1434058.1 unnamed protein product [Effrenium voratum]